MANKTHVLRNTLALVFDGLAEQYSHLESATITDADKVAIAADINDQLIILIGSVLYDGEPLH